MKRKSWLILGIIMAAIVLAVSGCSINPPSTSPVATGIVPNQQNTGIWVNGEGKVTVTPDVAILTLGVQAQEATVAQAQGEASTAMDAVVKELGARGVASKDIKTQRFSVTPVTNYDQKTQQQNIIAYRVDNIVTAKIRNVDNTGNIIDAVVKAGGNFTRINSISFTVDNPAPYQTQARDKAIADAQAKAKQLADAIGVQLGAPTYINESGGNVPVPYAQVSMMSAGPVPAPAPSISPGQTDITISVQVVYSIK